MRQPLECNPQQLAVVEETQGILPRLERTVRHHQENVLSSNMLMTYNVEWTSSKIMFLVNTRLSLTFVVYISTLKELVPNDCYMMNSGRGALFCAHYINDMGTQDRSTAGLAESIKYSAGSSALGRPCYSFREAVTCLSVMSFLIKVWSGGCGERVYVRGHVGVCLMTVTGGFDVCKVLSCCACRRASRLWMPQSGGC